MSQVTKTPETTPAYKVCIVPPSQPNRMPAIDVFLQLSKTSSKAMEHVDGKNGKVLSTEEVLKLLGEDLKGVRLWDVHAAQGVIRRGNTTDTNCNGDSNDDHKNRHLELLPMYYRVTIVNVENDTVTVCFEGDNKGWMRNGKQYTLAPRNGVGWYRVGGSKDEICFFYITPIVRMRPLIQVDCNGKVVDERKRDQKIITAAFQAAQKQLPPGSALPLPKVLKLIGEILANLGHGAAVFNCFSHGTPAPTTADQRLQRLRWQIDRYEAMTFEQAGRFLNEILEIDTSTSHLDHSSPLPAKRKRSQ